MKQAVKSLCKLRRLPADHPAIQEEIAEIYANHQCAFFDSFKRKRWLTILRRDVPWKVKLSRLLPRWYVEKNDHWLCATSFAAIDWCELHVSSINLWTSALTNGSSQLLLWHAVFHQRWIQKPVHHHCDYQLRQCCFDVPRSIPRGEDGQKELAFDGRRRVSMKTSHL